MNAIELKTNFEKYFSHFFNIISQFEGINLNWVCSGPTENQTCLSYFSVRKWCAKHFGNAKKSEVSINLNFLRIKFTDLTFVFVFINRTISLDVQVYSRREKADKSAAGRSRLPRGASELLRVQHNLERQQPEKLLVSVLAGQPEGESFPALVRTHAQGPPLQEHSTHAEGKKRQGLQYRSDHLHHALRNRRLLQYLKKK